MDMESAIIQMFANRIEEARSAVKKALEANTAARNMCRGGQHDKVEPILLVSHDFLLIAANTLHAIKDFIPHLALKDEKKGQAKDNTVYHLPPIR